MNAISWIATMLAVSAFFAYILVIGFTPALFARPIFSEGYVSIGLASGIALTVFLVVLSGIYTYLANKDELP